MPTIGNHLLCAAFFMYIKATNVKKQMSKKISLLLSIEAMVRKIAELITLNTYFFHKKRAHLTISASTLLSTG